MCAESDSPVFSESMSDEDFTAYLKNGGLRENDCKLLVESKLFMVCWLHIIIRIPKPLSCL